MSISELDISPWSDQNITQEQWKLRVSAFPKGRSYRYENQSELIQPLLSTHTKANLQKPIPPITAKNLNGFIKNKHNRINSESAQQILKKSLLSYLGQGTKRPTSTTIFKASSCIPVNKKPIGFQAKMNKQIYYNLASVNYCRPKSIKNLQVFENGSSDKQREHKRSIRYSEFYSLRKLNLTEVPNNPHESDEQFSDKKIRNSSRDPIQSKKQLAKTINEASVSVKEPRGYSNFIQQFSEALNKIKLKKDKNHLKRKRMIFS